VTINSFPDYRHLFQEP